MRYWLYNLLMWLLSPLWLIYSISRCRKSNQFWTCWRGLWTIDLPSFQQAPIWVHAVSLGETQAAFILLRQLRQQYPQQPIFFTGGNSSAVHYAQQQALSSVAVHFLPLDFACLRRRLFKRLRPKLLILMETEFWPNLLSSAHQQQVPVVILQARLSQSSRRNYPKYGQPLLGQLLAPVKLIAAQTQQDADILIQLGAPAQHTQLLGNLKYDFQLADNLTAQAAQLKERIGQRWIWSAGSTHPQEEIPLIAAQQHLQTNGNQPLLILVPRHPSYFDTLAKHLATGVLPMQRWTDWYASGEPLEPQTQILLVDTLGELMRIYAISDACFVGGSLVPWGGHNLLEPAALAKPMLAGPHNHNFAAIEQGLLAENALLIVEDAQQLATQLTSLQHKPAQAAQLGQAAQNYFYSQQGATKRVLNALTPWLANLTTS